MKTPKFLSKLSAVLTPRPKKKLQATARAVRPSVMDDYDAEEPTTKLSSAFIVVLILHVVAVGGIYAFNSIKASRRDREVTTKTVEPAAPATVKAAPQNDAPAVTTPTAPSHKTESAAPVAVTTSAKPAAGRQYEVKAGDTLTKIAFAYNVTSADIMTANQLKEGAVLRPGQSLVIPPAKTAAKPVADAAKTAATPKQTDIPPTKTTPGLYSVKKGDTLTSIARSFGLTSEELSKANRITDPKKLQLGQVLKVPPRKS
jgi:LysM repeat protein